MILNTDYSTAINGACSSIATAAASSNALDKTYEVAVLVTMTASLQVLEVPPLVNNPNEFIAAILSNFSKEVYRRKTRDKKMPTSKVNSH